MSFVYDERLRSLPSGIDTLAFGNNFIHFICQRHQFSGINDRECFHPAAHVPLQGILGDLIV